MCIPGGRDFEGSFSQSFKTLNEWLSILNGAAFCPLSEDLPKEIDCQQLILELEARRQRKYSKEDWRTYENKDGYTHFEELLLHQPDGWKEQAREYLLMYKVDVARQSSPYRPHPEMKAERKSWNDLFLSTPLTLVLFHPDIPVLGRNEGLSLLFAHGAQFTGVSQWREEWRMVDNPSYYDDDYSGSEDSQDLWIYDRIRIKHYSLHPWKEPDANTPVHDLSPLRYLWDLQKSVTLYNKNALVKRGLDFGVHRLPHLNELFFSSSVVGQQLAKARIIKLILCHFGRRYRDKCTFEESSGPLFLSFVGPNDTGKSDLAQEVGSLLTCPGDESYLSFGKEPGETKKFSKAWQAITEVIWKISKTPNKVGVVVMDCAFCSDLSRRIRREYSELARQGNLPPSNMIFIHTVAYQMNQSFDEIQNQDARADALVDKVISDSLLEPHLLGTAVPFLPLTRDELIAKTKLLLEGDVNAKGLSLSVKHEFAEYIAVKHGYSNEKLTSCVLLDQLDYWQLRSAEY